MYDMGPFIISFSFYSPVFHSVASRRRASRSECFQPHTIPITNLVAISIQYRLCRRRDHRASHLCHHSILYCGDAGVDFLVVMRSCFHFRGVCSRILCPGALSSDATGKARRVSMPGCVFTGRLKSLMSFAITAGGTAKICTQFLMISCRLDHPCRIDRRCI